MRTDKYVVGDIVELLASGGNPPPSLYILNIKQFRVTAITNVPDDYSVRRKHSQFLALETLDGKKISPERDVMYIGSYFKPIVREPASEDFLESISS